MTKLCLLGYGKMGKMLDSLADNEGFRVEYIFDGKGHIDEKKIQECDVAIDFSTPTAAFRNIETCILNKIPVLSGTTGWLERMDDVKQLLNENQEAAFMYGSNFSIGANVFFMLNKYLGHLMNDQEYELGITEIHHTTKLDAPSGTAITLAKDIISVNHSKEIWKNEKTNDTEAVSIISLREKDVKGTHIVHYENSIDEIKISHRAKSREGFSRGALKAAKWIIGKTGYFSVQDFIEEELKIK